MSASKALADLVASDLRAHPIWSWADDAEVEGDETFIEPQSLIAVPLDGDFQVSCSVTIANGRNFTGFIAVRDGGFDDDAPTVTADDGSMWSLTHPPHQKVRDAFRRIFGCSFNELFPVRWMLLVPFEGESALRSLTYASDRTETQVAARCPQCGSQLRSDRARQCPSCLARWT